MAAFDYQHKSRKHSWVHDFLPLMIVAVVCFIVVAWDIHV
jgi:hypothetical protein